MKRTIFLLAVLAIMAGCKDKTNSELSDGGKITLTGDDHKTPKVDFTAKRISPLMVEFTNESVGYTSYKWDFGDGTWSNSKDALHEFEQAGYDYPVTLTATDDDGNKASVRYEISLTKPDIWITGFVFYRIPVESRYYRLGFKDDKLLPSEWDFNTIYSPLLTSGDLPWKYMFEDPQMLIDPESHDHYQVLVYSSNSATGSGSEQKHLTQNIMVSDILKYPAEIRLETPSSKATIIGVTFGYDY